MSNYQQRFVQTRNISKEKYPGISFRFTQNKIIMGSFLTARKDDGAKKKNTKTITNNN